MTIGLDRNKSILLACFFAGQRLDKKKLHA